MLRYLYRLLVVLNIAFLVTLVGEIIVFIKFDRFSNIVEEIDVSLGLVLGLFLLCIVILVFLLKLVYKSEKKRLQK